MFSIDQIADVLRDQNDVGGDTLGMGNPKALNQMQGHHAVIFDNMNTTMYISTQDWQLGTFVGYDLSEIFASKQINISDTITQSKFLDTPEFKLFKLHKKLEKKLVNCLSSETMTLTTEDIALYISANSESFTTYESLGNYYQSKGQKESAISMFDIALTKTLPSIQVRDRISNKLNLNN